RAVVADLVMVPAGFKSLQLHANVPAAMTDIVSANPSVARTLPFWFDIMSISHPGMTAPRQIAWYAIDVERPAIDVPGLRENLYKLRVTRRILFDRESRPYFGDLADVAERSEVITREDFENREKAYWSRETPVGYITDLGFVMGLMIGMVFIYYAQYQIIRFYLPEYAILKSLGYDWWFFLCMIGQIGAAII